MATAFRLNSDGTVSVYIKPFFKTMTREEFEINSQKMDFEQFLYRIKEVDVKMSLRIDMQRLKRTDKLTRNGPELELDEAGNFVLAGCHVGKFYFRDFYKNPKIKKAAIKLGYEFYGKEKMDGFVEKGVFTEPIPEEVENATSINEFTRYYINGVELTKEEYQTIKKIIEGFTKIRDLKNPLDKSESIISKKVSKR